MKRKQIDLINGSLFKNILLFSLPLMFSNVLQVFFHMADIAIVGRFSGSIALGSVGSTATLVTLFTGFLIGVGSGINVLVAKYIGQKDRQRISESVHTGFIFCLILGILLLVLGQIFSKPLLNLLGTKPELLPGAMLYLKIYFLSMPGVALFNYGNAVFSAMGDTKKPLLFLSIAGVVNVILNIVFVVGFKMSVDGVAIATVISQYISALLLLYFLIKSKKECYLKAKELKLNSRRMVEMLKLGVPTGFQYSIFAIANLFIQAGVNTFDTVMVEGNSAAANADALLYDVMAAFYVACSTFIGQNYGANKKERVLKSFYVCLLYSFLVGVILGGSLIIFGKQFMSMFTTDEAVIQAGMKRINIMGWSYCFSAFMDTAIAASRGIGKTIVPTIIVILGSCVFRVIWIYTVFAYYKTFESLYLLYIFSYVLTSISELIYFAVSFRKIYPKNK